MTCHILQFPWHEAKVIKTLFRLEGVLLIGNILKQFHLPEAILYLDIMFKYEYIDYENFY